MFAREFCLLLVLLGVCESAKIIMIMPMYTKSHNTMFVHEAKILADRGHKITLVTPYPLTKAHPNIEQFRVGDLSKLEEDEDHHYFDGHLEFAIQFIYNFVGFFANSCEEFYQQTQVKSVIDHVTRNKGVKLYDLAIVEMLPTECALPFASLVANHTMLTSVINVPFWNAVEMRIPAVTSTTSMIYLTDFGTPTTFWQRFTNTFNSFGSYGIWKFLILPQMQDIATNYLPPWAPSVTDALKQVSLILTNEDILSVSPRPSLPFTVHVGGLHLQENEPLPQEIEDFIQSSGDEGVILLTFGSFLNTRDIPIKMRDDILDAFGKLKQKVLFKYHEQVDGAPKNVKLLPWLPQRDILAHPKVRLFITHGGMLSTQEVMYFGVPFVGLPIFADQHQNIAMLREFGMGEVLYLQDVTAETLYNVITKVLNDQSYADKAKEASFILKDRQNSASETVIYWIEYIIRHKGAPHLKNRVAQDLYLFQYLLLDVLAVMFLGIVFGAVAMVFIVKLLLKILFKNSKEPSKEKTS